MAGRILNVLKVNILYVYDCLDWMYVCEPISGVRGDQKRVQDPLELETVMSYQVGAGKVAQSVNTWCLNIGPEFDPQNPHKKSRVMLRV